MGSFWGCGTALLYGSLRRRVPCGDDGRMKEESPVPSPVILGIDDLRPLPWTTRIARSSSEGVKLLQEHRDSLIDELWLDHDLGGDDSILPVVTLLEEAAFNGRPFRIGTVYVHSANPIGAQTVVRSLTRWNYQVRRATV
ncbi:cyclic-phosphate processing receiver domain-containing protein [Streptomyces sp. NPDC006703]|uniref:cyclic-phosphate processing receiver domain-containing protein n=1 Tax=Streptomyces sp. NPDC006703 TaxID=3364759 RepID=UPI00369B49C0